MIRLTTSSPLCLCPSLGFRLMHLRRVRPPPPSRQRYYATEAAALIICASLNGTMCLVFARRIRRTLRQAAPIIYRLKALSLVETHSGAIPISTPIGSGRPLLCSSLLISGSGAPVISARVTARFRLGRVPLSAQQGCKGAPGRGRCPSVCD